MEKNNRMEKYILGNKMKLVVRQKEEKWSKVKKLLNRASAR